jgi:hypothetical protein
VGNDLACDSVEPSGDISTPRIWSVSSPVTKKATSTVSIEIHKGVIFDRLKINLHCTVASKQLKETSTNFAAYLIHMYVVNVKFTHYRFWKSNSFCQFLSSSMPMTSWILFFRPNNILLKSISCVFIKNTNNCVSLNEIKSELKILKQDFFF